MPSKFFTLSELHQIRFHWQLSHELAEKLAVLAINYGSYEQVNAAISYDPRFGNMMANRGNRYCFHSLTAIEPDKTILCSFRLMERGYPGAVLFKSVAMLSDHARDSFGKLGTDGIKSSHLKGALSGTHERRQAPRWSAIR